MHVSVCVHVCVCLCLFRGANLEAKDINNYTPIMRAIAYDHLSTVKKLLEYGCKVDTEVRHQKTLLEWAIENDYNVLVDVNIPVQFDSNYDNQCIH